MGMTRFRAWCKKKGFSAETGYRQVRLGNVSITKVGTLSFVTDEDDAAFETKLPKLDVSQKAVDAALKATEHSVKKLAELIGEGQIDRSLVRDRLSAIF
jgi:hypothetical protein